MLTMYADIWYCRCHFVIIFRTFQQSISIRKAFDQRLLHCSQRTAILQLGWTSSLSGELYKRKVNLTEKFICCMM